MQVGRPRNNGEEPTVRLTLVEEGGGIDGLRSPDFALDSSWYTGHLIRAGTSAKRDSRTRILRIARVAPKADAVRGPEGIMTVCSGRGAVRLHPNIQLRLQMYIASSEMLGGIVKVLMISIMTGYRALLYVDHPR